MQRDLPDIHIVGLLVQKNPSDTNRISNAKRPYTIAADKIFAAHEKDRNTQMSTKRGTRKSLLQHENDS